MKYIHKNLLSKQLEEIYLVEALSSPRLLLMLQILGVQASKQPYIFEAVFLQRKSLISGKQPPIGHVIKDHLGPFHPQVLNISFFGKYLYIIFMLLPSELPIPIVFLQHSQLTKSAVWLFSNYHNCRSLGEKFSDRIRMVSDEIKIVSNKT